MERFSAFYGQNDKVAVLIAVDYGIVGKLIGHCFDGLSVAAENLEGFAVGAAFVVVADDHIAVCCRSDGR